MKKSRREACKSMMDLALEKGLIQVCFPNYALASKWRFVCYHLRSDARILGISKYDNLEFKLGQYHDKSFYIEIEDTHASHPAPNALSA